MNKRNKSLLKNSIILCALPVIFSSMAALPLREFKAAHITGPDCARSGTEYQYIISGNSDSLTGMQLCITGGVFVHNEQSCLEDTMLTEVRVIWTDSVRGSLTLRSGGGNISKHVTLTKELQPGLIESSVVRQIIKSDHTPVSVNCSAASGGGCSPVYTYQWMQSADNIKWTNTSGAVNQHLEFSSALPQSTFFRRKVTDTKSGTVAYSDIAAVFVEPTGH
jgi:hypothetical protein